MTNNDNSPIETSAIILADGPGDVVLFDPSLEGLAELSAQAETYHAGGVLVSYRAGLSENTRKRHDTAFGRFVDYLASAGLADADLPTPARLQSDPIVWLAISPGLIAGFSKWLLGRGYSLSTIKGDLTAIRGYAVRGNPALESALKGVDLPSARNDNRPNKRRQGAKGAKAFTLTPHMVDRLMLSLNGFDVVTVRNRAMIALLADHGLRRSELAPLTVENFSPLMGTLAFYRQKVDLDGKHALTQRAYDCLVEWVGAYEKALGRPLAPSDPLFPSIIKRGRGDGTRYTLTDKPITDQGVTDLIARLGLGVGIPRLSPHDFRHYWASQAAQAGSDVLALQKAGGWKSLAMPSHYVTLAGLDNDGLKGRVSPMARKVCPACGETVAHLNGSGFCDDCAPRLIS